MKNGLNILPLEKITREDCSYYIHRSVIGEDFPMHSHEFFEIDIVVSGSARSNINGKIYEISKNSMLFLTPADFHDIVLNSDEKLVNYNIAFPTDIIYRRVWSYVPMSCRIATLSDDAWKSAISVCELMHREYVLHSSSAELMLKTGIEWCLLLLSNAAVTESVGEVPTGNITAVLAYIYDNFTGEITRDAAAEILHVSPMYFSKYFHSRMGISFQEYVMNLRLDYARKMLASEQTSVGDAALASGFNSSGYFSRVFSRRFGIPPKEYADKCRACQNGTRNPGT